jgi:hypothetical protein
VADAPVADRAHGAGPARERARRSAD